MGCCSKCGNKIRYNAFKKIKGIIYCLKCVPEERVSKKIADTIPSAGVTFDELQSATAIIEYNEPVKKKPKKRKRSKKKSGK